jgi:hypothetical protein
MAGALAGSGKGGLTFHKPEERSFKKLYGCFLMP